jgi:tRNA(Ile)-lysidine synthase
MGQRGVAMPNADRLDEILRQSVTSKDGARVRIDVATHDLYRWKGGLRLVPRRQPVVQFARTWRNERRLNLPELGGVLRMARAPAPGICLAKLREQPVVVRARVGGERLQPDCRRPRRTLKNLFQERGIPPWERDRVPLLYCGSKLVWVPGVGIDCAYQAAPREPSVNPVWLPASAE